MVDRNNWREAHIVMAVLADIGCLDMPRILADGLDAVVTVDAGTDNISVVKVGGYPAISCVTVVAGIAAGSMGRVLPGGNCAVMAGVARANYLRVIDRIGGCEYHAIVTVLTNIGRLDVGRVLADCIGPVVAAKAVASDRAVVEVCRNPAVGRVALIAGIAATYVWRILSGGNRAVVAGRTRADDLRMIDPVRRCEDKIVMTVLANIGRLEVGRVFADGVATVVATKTVGHDVRVFKKRRCPAVSCMAVVAVISAADVCRVLARGNRAVMAGRAEPDYLGMIDRVGWCEERAVVTIFADIAGLNMRRVLADGIRAVVAGCTSA